MTTKTINLYTFDELSDAAKEKARDWWRELEGESFGAHAELYETIETAAKLLGIEFKRHDVGLMGGGKRSEPCVWWTLDVQGAGASFDGLYDYRKGSVKAITSEFPKDAELQRIARELAAIQKKYQYHITAAIKSDSRGHFLEVEADRGDAAGNSMDDADDEALRELFRDFTRWIYKLIDAEYDYRMSDENVDDAILANEYTFTESGKHESE